MLVEEARTVAQAVQERLSADILSGRLQPGARLRLHSLCTAFSVSMSPLREALAGLTGLGLVVQEGQRGFRVASTSDEDLRDLLDTRVRLEIQALRLAIERGGAEWEASILAAHHQLMRHPRTPDKLVDEEWERLHRRFHLALIEACGSPRQLSFCLALHDHFDRYRRIAVLRSGRHPSLRLSHAELVESVVEKDVERASNLLTAHIRESAAAFVKLAGPEGFSSKGNGNGMG
jgi:GntR family transcriptional regulator, carbon starvation induced regulator